MSVESRYEKVADTLINELDMSLSVYLGRFKNNNHPKGVNETLSRIIECCKLTSTESALLEAHDIVQKAKRQTFIESGPGL